MSNTPLDWALIPGDGIIARQSENVVEIPIGQLPGLAHQPVAVEVLAREVDDDFLAAFFKRSSQRVRGNHGIAAGIVGNREGVKARISG